MVLTAGAALAALVVAVPILAVVLSLATPAHAVWAHLWRTQLVELLGTRSPSWSASASAPWASGSRWPGSSSSTSSPGAAPSSGRSSLPLALPAYVIGFVFLGMFEFAGPLQTASGDAFGPGVRLPDLRSGGASSS